VALNENGMPDFQALQNYQTEADGELHYYVFDLLYLNGHSIMHLPLNDRKNLLEELLEQVPEIDFCDHVDATGKEFFENAVDAGYEGVIAKKADSKYFAGTRSKNWLKLKTIESQEAIICGYTEGERVFGSLILGAHNADGDLVYIGNCGTGFNEQTQKELFEKFRPLKVEKKPFIEKINLKGRKPHWLKPELICEVTFAEFTKTGSLRHPSFKGLRSDKIPSEIKTQNGMAEAMDTKKKETKKKLPKKKEAQKGSRSSRAKDTLEVEGINVPVSNLDKVLWPDEGYTKYDMLEYYLAVSETMLPYLKDRPQNLNRHPEDRKSTRLNSSHVRISYAVFCLKKKKQN